MTTSRISVFRNALQVSPKWIAALGETDLDLLMLDLLKAEAYRCQSPINEIRVNTEEKAADDGCDAWSSAPGIENDWLGSADTCWQLKAGQAGQPAKIKNEVGKPIPAATLQAGGRFVVVTSGSTSGPKGEKARLTAVQKEAAELGLPIDQIDIIGSERLAVWINQHPAVAAHWAGRPEGLCTLAEWGQLPIHQVEWQTTDAIDALFDEKRADLGFAAGDVRHLHVFGHPGVGKTRFVLELCREAEWAGAVIYIRQAEDIRLAELLDSASSDDGVQLLVVADEVQPEQLLPLCDSVDRGAGRIRLITIGHCRTPEPARIPALKISPANREQMREIVHGWYPGMPREHIDFVVTFSDGYVRLANLAANAVARNPQVDVRTLLGRHEIRNFFDRMLGEGDRRALYVVAVLDSVGWFGEKSVEGQKISELLGLDWAEVRAKVDEFHRRFEIVPRGGDYRYLSPTPLGAHLAAEAWETYPEELQALPDLLPSDKAREAYFKRVSSIASNAHTTEFARTELQFFFRRSMLMDPSDIKRWSALSAADPELAAKELLRALFETSLTDRLAIKDRARRDLVWTLVKLAWCSTAFHDAVISLALLGEAENETWSNNASGEFIARYQIRLGGTAVPYVDRLPVLEELLKLDRIGLTLLVVKALTRASEMTFTRTQTDPISDQPPEPEWHPNSEENLAAIKAALTKLREIAPRAIPELKDTFLEAANRFSRMIQYTVLYDDIALLFTGVRDAYPDARESLRRSIARVIDDDRRIHQKLSSEQLNLLEDLHSDFEDDSISARLQQFVGPAIWDSKNAPDLTSIGQELMDNPGALKDNWAWLTSGEAGESGRLGKTLAEIDADLVLANKIPLLPGAGTDNRLLCGYLRVMQVKHGDEWLDQWVVDQSNRDPTPISILFEVAWRCSATSFLTSKIVELIKTESVPAKIVGQLVFGAWGNELSFSELSNVIHAMRTAGHSETAICLLANRLSTHTEEIESWRPIGLELILDKELIRSAHMINYYWGEVSKHYIDKNAREISSAIFKAHSIRDSESWFVEHSEAKAILSECMEIDASGVWQELQPYLLDPEKAVFFCIGFPKTVLEKAPVDEVLEWVKAEPEKRGARVSRLAGKDLSSDDSLSAQLLGQYGDNEDMAGAFFSEYISGFWWGSISDHWDELASYLDRVANNSKLPKLQRWASKSASSLRNMASQERKREEEEELRGP